MKLVKKLLIFVSIFFLYLILREFLELYANVKALHPAAGYVLLILLLGIVVYFLLLPIFRIIRIPANAGPVKNQANEGKLISQRISRFRKNPYLLSTDFDFSGIKDERESYDRIIRVMKKEADRLRKKHVSQIFYSTSIAQNGFLDALLILSISINHVKELFILYNGRVSNKDLINIGRKVYFSMAIGGSEGSEYLAEELFSRFATESLKSVPFIDKIISSILDGLVNAALLTRISYITENYCRMTYIKSEKDLYPSPSFIMNSVKNITADIIERLFRSIRRMTVDHSINFALAAANPVGYVIGKSIDRKENIDPQKREQMKEYAKLIGNPLAFGLEKLYKSFRK